MKSYIEYAIIPMQHSAFVCFANILVTRLTGYYILSNFLQNSNYVELEKLSVVGGFAPD